LKTPLNTSDFNKDWTHKDIDQAFKDKVKDNGHLQVQDLIHTFDDLQVASSVLQTTLRTSSAAKCGHKRDVKL